MTPLNQIVCKNPRSLFGFLQIFKGEYSFAQLRIQDVHSYCTTYDQSVIAVTMDGNYYVAEIDPVMGGECKITKYTNLIQERF